MSKELYARLLARKIGKAKTYPEKCKAIHAWRASLDSWLFKNVTK